MKLLTIEQAAEDLQCSPKTLRRAIKTGRLKVARLGSSPKSDRIHPDDLEQYINHSRALRGSCPLENVVAFGGSPSRTADKELERRLALARQKNKRSSSKLKSVRTSTLNG